MGLTTEFNRGRPRVIISCGQACVWYRLSMVSKDGDWIVTEDASALEHVLTVLERHGARYRLGAPLSTRYLAAGWSSHFEFTRDQLRMRTDFISRPPRISPQRLRDMWDLAQHQFIPALAIPDLITILRTMRDRDYPIIGALALRLSDPESILRFSIAARSLSRTISEHPAIVKRLTAERPLLAVIASHPEQAAAALMQERLAYMEADRLRIEAYQAALQPWAQRWLKLQPLLADKSLREVHAIVLAEAQGLLPESVPLA
jgi:hypothetical protein